MISYKVKGIILAVIIFLASIMMPFSVYADTITNSNVNINYYLDSVTETTSGTYMQTYRVEFVFDQSYLGWISSKMVGTYINNNTVPVTTAQFTKTQSIYVNGVIAETSFSIVTPNTQNGGALQSLSQSIQNSSVTILSDLSTLDDILNVLSDIQNTLNIDVMDDLDQILIDVGLASDYLEILSKLKQYNVPIESLAFTASVLNFSNNTIIENSNYTYSLYPIISVKTRNYLYAVWSQESIGDYYLIIGNNNLTNSISRFNQYFEITNAEIKSIKMVYSSYYNYDFAVVKFSRINNGYCYFRNIVDVNLIPVYMGSVNNKNVSTEFALQWGLSNQLLDDIHQIANGTTQSNSVASDLESEASEYSEIADDVIGVEEGLTSNFETSVNQIDLNTGLNAFGGNFMTSATWVRTQFDRLTENTPYGSLVVYGLTLGFVLLMLGKVLL